MKVKKKCIILEMAIVLYQHLQNPLVLGGPRKDHGDFNLYCNTFFIHTF